MNKIKLSDVVYVMIRVIAIVLISFLITVIFAGLFGCNDGGASYIPPGKDSTWADTIIIKPDTILIPRDTVIKETDTAKAAYKIQKLFEAVPAVLAMTNGVETIKLDLKEGVDNYEYLQDIIDNVPVDGRMAYSVGNGNYFFSKTIKIHNKSIWIIGTNGSVFTFPNGVSGIQITRDHYIYPCLLQNIDIVAQSNSDPNADGLDIQSITHLFNVNVLRFGGYGMSYRGDIKGAGTDVSNSFLIDCGTVQNGKDGLYFAGGDANACLVLNYDGRDNGGYGIYDHSFLGNYFIGPMTHNNKRGAVSDDPNARSVFVGPYNEGGQEPSLIGGAGRVYGGISGNGAYWIAKDWAKIDQQ